MNVRAHDDLLIGGNHPVHQRRMFRRRYLACPRQPAQIVDTFKHDEPVNTRRREYIAIETRQRVWPKPICEEMISADPLVHDSDGSGRG
jgi:hypothetical protein